MTRNGDGTKRKSARVRTKPKRNAKEQRYVLRLYIAGGNRLSRHAVERVREICDRAN